MDIQDHHEAMRRTDDHPRADRQDTRRSGPGWPGGQRSGGAALIARKPAHVMATEHRASRVDMTAGPW